MYLKMKKFTDISVFFLSFLTSLGIIANRNTIVDVTQSCKFYIFGHDSIEEWRENTFKKIKRMRKGTHLLNKWWVTEIPQIYFHIDFCSIMATSHQLFCCLESMIGLAVLYLCK